MRVLIACEESQRVCTAFRQRGHEAYSCDLIDCSGGHPEWHIKADALPLINGNCTFNTMDGKMHQITGAWDLLIAHPPCTYLTNAGARHLWKGGQLQPDREHEICLCVSGMRIFREWSLKIQFHPRFSVYLSIPKLFSPFSSDMP